MINPNVAVFNPLDKTETDSLYIIAPNTNPIKNPLKQGMKAYKFYVSYVKTKTQQNMNIKNPKSNPNRENDRLYPMLIRQLNPIYEPIST